MQSSSTIPNYPNSSFNNINYAINSNNTITGTNNINITGSNSMSFAAQQNFILKNPLNEQQQNQSLHLQLPNISSAVSVGTTPS